MSITLIGVGADGDHVKPVPSITEDGKYEYIPIPDTCEDTAEEYTYGNFPLKTQDGTAIDIVEKIAPYGDGNWITDKDVIRDYPVHHDPNFEELTFGDKRGKGGTGGTLASLSPGDGIGFYTGLNDGDGKNRYLYGFFTVSEVVDLEGLQKEDYRDRLRQYPDNAHAKRLIGNGEAKHEGGEDGCSLVIVDGEEPGGLLNDPVKMTSMLPRQEYGNTYWLTKRFIEEFDVQGNLNDKTGRYGVDIKNAIDLDMSIDIFQKKVKEWKSS